MAGEELKDRLFELDRHRRLEERQVPFNLAHTDPTIPTGLNNKLEKYQVTWETPTAKSYKMALFSILLQVQHISCKSVKHVLETGMVLCGSTTSRRIS
jgi:hypothetical protein